MKRHNKKPIKKINFKIDEIVLVLVVAVLAAAVVSYEKSRSISPIEAEKITALLMDEHEFSIVDNGVVDGKKLDEIENMDYRQLKKEFNIKKDFCMYLEDENGNIILAKGSEKLIKDNSACKG